MMTDTSLLYQEAHSILRANIPQDKLHDFSSKLRDGDYLRVQHVFGGGAPYGDYEFIMKGDKVLCRRMR